MEKYHQLLEVIKPLKRVIVAFSGGVDSTLLLKAALDALGPENVLACLAVSETLSQDQHQTARDLAKQLHAPYEEIQTDELADPNFTANSPDRCYYCRLHLFRLLTERARRENYHAVLCGANLDDLDDYRPGSRAAKEFDIQSPLQEAKLTKQDIRQISRQLDLPTWNQPASPCLASRLAYNLSVTPERLRQIEQAEIFLRWILPENTPFRLRHHGSLARIEIPPERFAQIIAPPLRDQIIDHLKQLGFHYITLDLQGFRSGSANEPL